MKKETVFLSIVFIVLLMAGCTRSTVSTNAGSGKVRIAFSYGLSFAPAHIMEKKALLQKYLPGMDIEYTIMGSAGIMAEAFIADKLDIAFMAVPNFLIAKDKGADIGVLAGYITSPPMGLVVKDSNIKSLRDFKPNDKIAVTTIGGIDHIMIAMACERQLGNSHALDNNLIAMTRPDAMTALISGGGITAHFTALPYLAKENDEGFPTILTGVEAFGQDFPSGFIVTSKKLYKEAPLAAAAFLLALSEADELIYKRDPDAISIIAAAEKTEPEKILEYLDRDGSNYTTTIYGLEGLADFMFREGYISKKPALEEILWEPALAAIGKRSGSPSILEKAQQRGE